MSPELDSPAATPSKRLRPLLKLVGIFTVIGLVIFTGAYFTLDRFFRATFGQPNIPEIQMLAWSTSPDGRLEARLVRVIGGSGFGGAVVWQEVQLAPKDSDVRFFAGQNQPGLAFSVVQDSESPIAELKWVSSDRLLIKSDKLTHENTYTTQLLGVAIEFKELPKPKQGSPAA